jgi:alpha-tubulin suppressor-like RCC1 family protein
MPMRLSGVLAAVAVIASLSPAVPAAASSEAISAALPQTIQAWGSNVYGELGNGTTTGSDLPGAVTIPAHTTFTSARCLLTCLAVTKGGQVYAWGRNNAGQVGDGTTKQRLTPVRVHLPAGVNVTAVRPGGDFSLALTAGGKVLAWGDNAGGELGNGSRKSSRLPVPVRLPKGVTIKAISAGEGDSFALTSTGRVLSWGGNGNGQLGTGTTKGRLTPGYVSLPTGTTVASIAAGPLTGYAVTKGGGMLAWGLNNDGQLGDGTTKQRDKPVRVSLPTGTKVVAAVSGLQHVLALTKGGKVLAWGDNQVGQLGIGTTVDRHRPAVVSLPTGTKVSALAAGKDYSMALTNEGVQPGPIAGPGSALPVVHAILVWGGNEAGQLGTGTTAGSLVPVAPKLSSLQEPTSIGSGWGSVTSVAVCTQQPV